EPLLNPNYQEAFKRFGDLLLNKNQRYFNNRSLTHLPTSLIQTIEERQVIFSMIQIPTPTITQNITITNTQ
ncbi:17357_t:CDS:2, partial [Racocetra persica]